MQSASEAQTTKKISLTAKIVVGMISGAIIGVIFSVIDSQFINLYVVDGVLDMIGTMFINALQMLVVPLVVFSLICGVTGIGDIRLLGRVGGLSLTIYLITTAIAIASAILVAIAIGPGSHFELAGTSPAADAMTKAPGLGCNRRHHSVESNRRPCRWEHAANNFLRYSAGYRRSYAR